MRYDDVLALVGAFSPVFALVAYAIGLAHGRREQLEADCRTVKRVIEERVDKLRGGEWIDDQRTLDAVSAALSARFGT